MLRNLMLTFGICAALIGTKANADPYCEESIGTPWACDPWLYDINMKAKITKITSFYIDYQGVEILNNELNPKSIHIGDNINLNISFNEYYLFPYFMDSMSFNFQLNDLLIKDANKLGFFELDIIGLSIPNLYFDTNDTFNIEGLSYVISLSGWSYGPSNVNVWSESNLDFEVRNFRGILALDYWGSDFGIFHHIYFDTEYAGRVSPIPEPGVWLMLVAGFGAVGMAARRRLGTTDSPA